MGNGVKEKKSSLRFKHIQTSGLTLISKTGKYSKASKPYPSFKIASIDLHPLLVLIYSRMTKKLVKVVEPQMGEHVFTTTGWHVPKPEGLSNGVTFVIAHPPCSKNFTTIVESLQKEGIATHRASLSLTLREKGLSMEAAEVQKYLIVGITFLNLPAAIEKRCPTVKKGGVVGTKAGGGNKADLVGSMAPYLVVTPEISEDQKSGSRRTNLYALIMEKPAPNDLCLPTIVSQSKVFYLARFRESSTTRDKRASEWNKLAAKEAIRYAPLAAISTKQERQGRSRDTTKVVLDPVLSLRNSIRHHLTSYPGTPETWHLQEALLVMEQAVDDPKDMYAPSNTALREFIDNENDDFDEDDAETMNKEMTELWPGFEKFLTTDLLTLKKQITDANVFIEYRLLRPFLAEAAYLLKTIDEGQDQSRIVETALQTVTRVMASNGFVVQKEIPEDMELLSTFQKGPESVSESSEAFDEVMGDSDGEQMDTESS
ncbi:hypothetical protein BGAL_0249g00090 [Botrytis galanthina]|uniref:Uncharacterized protein n=1 Tax=Botrytis galanthina TaxID=278940 RepID=A0A4S8R5G7_9HELO|nr:hypothetical protein BGAL_0249g00090 [Botrytis galanthina]